MALRIESVEIDYESKSLGKTVKERMMKGMISAAWSQYGYKGKCTAWMMADAGTPVWEDGFGRICKFKIITIFPGLSRGRRIPGNLLPNTLETFREACAKRVREAYLWGPGKILEG